MNCQFVEQILHRELIEAIFRIQWYVPASRKRAIASGEENVGKFNNDNITQLN